MRATVPDSSPMRGLESRFYGALRHDDADQVMDQPARPWDLAALHGHHHVLLVTWRRDGRAVPTPVWFAVSGEEIVLRSGADDGKVKRIRRDGRAAIAPCTGRGRPQGAPMLGTARLLSSAEEEQQAEAALRAAIGVPRRVYEAARGRSLDVTYIAVSAERR
jgi:PPOX class probable F420-dependent enzyme